MLKFRTFLRMILKILSDGVIRLFVYVFIFIFSFVIGTEKPLWGSGQ